MNKNLEELLVVFSIILLFSLAYTYTIFEWTIMHESAHVQINSKFDLNSTVSIRFVGPPIMFEGYTYVNQTDYDLLTIADEKELKILNAQNEITGYNSKAIITAIFFVGGIIAILIYLVCNND